MNRKEELTKVQNELEYDIDVLYLTREIFNTSLLVLSLFESNERDLTKVPSETIEELIKLHAIKYFFKFENNLKLGLILYHLSCGVKELDYKICRKIVKPRNNVVWLFNLLNKVNSISDASLLWQMLLQMNISVDDVIKSAQKYKK